MQWMLCCCFAWLDVGGEVGARRPLCVYLLIPCTFIYRIFSFIVIPGTIVALVGTSGSGKSTVVKVSCVHLSD